MANSSDDILVFDIGANIGNKTAGFIAKGARVVCFEPVPQCVNELRLRFEGNPLVTIVNGAVGSASGTLPISICSTATTISTFSDNWKHGRFGDMVWDKTLDVPVQPLDAAISEYGLPDYCKIDVEGFELAVLQGLSYPIPVLSFEFAFEGLSQTAACLERLERLGYRRFNVAYGEFDVMRHDHWLGAQKLMDELREHRYSLIWGNIYAARDQGPGSAVEALLPRLPVCEDVPLPECDTLDQLLWRGLASVGAPVRLHLASGDEYLPGYINIDCSGLVQPDFSADITTLAFEPCSLDEIRIGRDVYERFNRMVFLRLLIRCQRWLKPGRLLLIESPGSVYSMQRKSWGNCRSLLDCCRIALSRKASNPTGNAVAPR
jgi:FkbM family methyltransferase